MSLPIGNNLKHLAEASLQVWFAQHQAELIELVRGAQHERIVEILRAACKERPILAGVLSLLKYGDVRQALSHVAQFDPALAGELSRQLQTFEKVRLSL